MPVARFAAIALLLFPLSAFSQDQPASSHSSPAVMVATESRSSAATTPSEPWKIIPSSPQSDRLTQTFAGDINDYNPNAYMIAASGNIVPIYPLRNDTKPLLRGDEICYTIRSYQVARDAKDSDSTHPVGSSTCQPARHYGVKKVQVEPDSHGR